jgi:hypothetical protein
MQAARVSPQARWSSRRRKPSGRPHISSRGEAFLCGPSNGVQRRHKPAKRKGRRGSRELRKGIGRIGQKGDRRRGRRHRRPWRRRQFVRRRRWSPADPLLTIQLCYLFLPLVTLWFPNPIRKIIKQSMAGDSALPPSRRPPVP